MRIFISHKLEDAATANLIAKELKEIKVECYLDLLDNSITETGVAMGNAIDEVKERADIVIGSNDEDGIAGFIENEIL